MKVTSSYRVELKKINKFLAQTASIYRKSIDFLICVLEWEWDSLKLISNPQQRALAAERLIHDTSKNTAKYKFDEQFPKFPSYLRRSAVKAALGILSSYHTNLKNWEDAGSKGARPTLPKTTRLLPVFYRENMYREGEDPYTAYLKLYLRNDWVWVSVRLKKTDVDYIRKYWSHTKAFAPVLEKRYKKYFLRFSFEEDVDLSVTKLEDQIVCAVDLGINTDAVCSILTSNGTVAIRKFINFPADKDHLYKVLDSIRDLQSRRGPKSIKGLWAYVKRLNDELAKKIAREIVSFAAENFADVIVFEHLDMKGKKHGPKKQRLFLWRKNGIQGLVEHKAHRCGIRVSRVNARNTSRLAYDGSGEVLRDKKNHSLCAFSTGKQYNCDLSASYNIGARYFIRCLMKGMSKEQTTLLRTKVPESGSRTTNTLDTLRKVYAFLKAI